MSVDIEDRKIASQGFTTFIGILTGCEFTIVVLILSFENIPSIDLTNWSSLNFQIILSILWIIISIFSCLETIIGYINFDRKQKMYNFHYSSAFYYLGIYSFYTGMIHLLAYKRILFIALILYYFLFYKIITWTRVLFLRAKKIKESFSDSERLNIESYENSLDAEHRSDEKRKEKKIQYKNKLKNIKKSKQDNKEEIDGYKNEIKKIINIENKLRRISYSYKFSKLNIGLLGTSIIFFFFMYFPCLGKFIYNNISIIGDEIEFLFWVVFIIIWIFSGALLWIQEKFFKIYEIKS